MLKIIIALVVLFLNINFTYAQNAEGLKLSRSDLVGMEETRFATYAENSLWGYINGGADLYLEYGFKEVMVQNFVWESEPFKVDVYIMENPEAAFGIFSVSRFSCKNIGKLGTWDCINPYQIQVAHGSLYISVIPYNATDRSMELGLKIAEKIMAKHRAKPLKMSQLLDNERLVVNRSKIKLFYGHLALQNAYSSVEHYFEGVDNYKLWSSDIQLNGATFSILYATFDGVENCQQVISRIPLVDSHYIASNGNKFLLLIGENAGSAADGFAELVNIFKGM
jgi:hypothetical protein